MRARFAKPYVDALFEIAGSADAVEAIVPQLAAFAGTLRSSDELRALVRNPGIERERKKAVVDAIAKRSGVDGIGGRFLQALLGNNRLLAIDEILAAINERLDRDRNVVEALVTSAAPLAERATGEIKTALEGKTKSTVRLKHQVDPALLGGFVVKLGSEVYDASLKARLERARLALHTADGAEQAG
jgi:F-type H+-transporting ATPase subunit delta